MAYFQHIKYHNLTALNVTLVDSKVTFSSYIGCHKNWKNNVQKSICNEVEFLDKKSIWNLYFCIVLLDTEKKYQIPDKFWTHFGPQIGIVFGYFKFYHCITFN